MPHEPATIVITGPPEPILVLVENAEPVVSAETASEDLALVIIEPSEPVLVLVENPEPVVCVEVAMQGPPGPPGPKGDSGSQDVTVNGFEIQIDAPATGDVLSYAGTYWGNRRQESLTDGGNF